MQSYDRRFCTSCQRYQFLAFLQSTLFMRKMQKSCVMQKNNFQPFGSNDSRPSHETHQCKTARGLAHDSRPISRLWYEYSGMSLSILWMIVCAFLQLFLPSSEGQALECPTINSAEYVKNLVQGPLPSGCNFYAFKLFQPIQDSGSDFSLPLSVGYFSLAGEGVGQ